MKTTKTCRLLIAVSAFLVFKAHPQGLNIPSSNVNSTGHKEQYYASNETTVAKNLNIGNASEPEYKKACCADTAKTKPTDITESNDLKISSIYPNLAGDALNLNYPGQTAEINIYTSNGGLVFWGRDKIRKLDISSLAPGTYYLVLTNEKITENHTFVKY